MGFGGVEGVLLGEGPGLIPEVIIGVLLCFSGFGGDEMSATAKMLFKGSIHDHVGIDIIVGVANVRVGFLFIFTNDARKAPLANGLGQ